MIFKKEWIEEITFCDDGKDSEGNVLKFIEESGWSSQGKYEYNTYYFEYKGKYYSLDDWRTGSYYTDYTYEHDDWTDEVECQEVVKKEVVKYEWVEVNKV